MNEKYPISKEDGLYLLALGLALLMRLVVLDHLPLNEIEATWAWQAYQVSKGQAVQIGSQPAYVLLTGALFYLFGSGDTLARLLPALVGSAVLALPYALRDQLGRKTALVAAFGLALDPLLVAFSRQSGSAMFVVGFASLAVAAWSARRWGWLGIFAGLLLLSGPGVWFGLVALVVTAILVRLVLGDRTITPSTLFDSVDIRRLGMAFAATVLVVGTLFMRYPQGLSAMLVGLTGFFSGWINGSGALRLHLLAALPVYQPLAMLFGIVAFTREHTWGRSLSAYLAVLSLVALALAMFNPARQMADLAWVLIPLWLLAGQQIARFISRPEPEDRVVVWLQALLSLVLLEFWLLNLGMMTKITAAFFPPDFSITQIGALDPTARLYLGRIAVTVFIPLLLLLLISIVYYGWPGPAAYQGATWGVGAFLLFYVVGTAFGFADSPTVVAGELWMPPRSPGYVHELHLALEEISTYSVGTQTEIEVVYQIDSDLLRWLLRDMPNARYAPVLSATELPAVVISDTLDFGDQQAGSLYKGQHFALQFERDWADHIFPLDFDRWLLYRESPLRKQWVFLWTRQDLFPALGDSP